MFYILISVSFYTVQNLLQRRLAVESKFPRAASVLFTGIGGLIAVAYAVIVEGVDASHAPKTLFPWVLVGIACLCYGLFERGRFLASKILEASIFTTLINVSMIVTTVVSVFLLGEKISMMRFAGIVAIFVGLFLVSWESNIKSLFSQKNALGLGLGVLLGMAWSADKFALMHFPATFYSMFVWTFPILAIIFPRIQLSNLKSEWKLGSWGMVLLSSLNVFGYIAQVKAMEKVDLSIVIPLIQTSVVLTVIFAAIFLGEKKRLVVKIVAACLAVLGTKLLI